VSSRTTQPAVNSLRDIDVSSREGGFGAKPTARVTRGARVLWAGEREPV